MGRAQSVLTIPLIIGASILVFNLLEIHQYTIGSNKDTEWVMPQKDGGARSATSTSALTNQGLRVQSIQGIDNVKNVVGNPQFLLDFAIIGFPKCGTTTMSKWLESHSEVKIPGNEMQALSEGRPAGAVEYLHRQYIKSNSVNVDYKRGYKSPYDITNMGDSLVSLKKYWPKTQLIVGIRHPVHWFESYVNYRIMNGVLTLSRVQAVNSLVHKCYKLLCVKTAHFHVFLDGLGKTNSTMLDVHYKKKIYDANSLPIPPPVPHKVFLYDIAQLADKNETRQAQFGRDIQNYLGLKAEMPPMVHVNEGKQNHNGINKDILFIDICGSRYYKLRQELMKAARRASVWIRTYFLDSDDVYVSSREYLEEILASWMIDPCDNVNTKEAK